jgi:hypothetical protein
MSTQMKQFNTYSQELKDTSMIAEKIFHLACFAKSVSKVKLETTPFVLCYRQYDNTYHLMCVEEVNESNNLLYKETCFLTDFQKETYWNYAVEFIKTGKVTQMH